MLTLLHLPERISALELLVFYQLCLKELLLFPFVGALILFSWIISQEVKLLLVLDFDLWLDALVWVLLHFENLRLGLSLEVQRIDYVSSNLEEVTLTESWIEVLLVENCLFITTNPLQFLCFL